ncbi:hypothetical protein SEVIR_7G187675v4 [Setaria viridis]
MTATPPVVVVVLPLVLLRLGALWLRCGDSPSSERLTAAMRTTGPAAMTCPWPPVRYTLRLLAPGAAGGSSTVPVRQCSEWRNAPID